MVTKEQILTSYVEAGFVPIPLNGKVAIKKAWQETPYEIEVNPADFPGNFGLNLQPDQIVIDIDPRNFDPDDKPHVRLFKKYGIDIKACTVVKTGSGGLHVYFRKPADRSIRKKMDDYPGIEFLSVGAYVVGVGSKHPDTGRTYDLIQGTLKPLPEIPEELLVDLHGAMRVRREKTEAAREYADRVEDRKRFIDYLNTAPAAIEGDGGDQQTYKVACVGQNYDLSPDVVYELMLEHYNPRCLPPWEETELHQKIENAYRYALEAPGAKTPEADFKEVASAEREEDESAGFNIAWDRQSNGQLKKTLRNVVNWFFVKTSGIYKTVAFDEFKGQVLVMTSLPWRQIDYPSQWTDDDSKQLRFYLGHKFKFDAPTPLIDESVFVAAQKRTIHPIRDYLTGLKWDGVKRLNKWMIDYVGCEDTIYAREIGAKLLLQAVARVYHPGCKVDHVVVLEGAQGTGKSTLVEALAGEYYADIIIDPHSRDTVDAMRGAWFVEFSEMEVTKRAEMQALKAFITRKVDKVRLAYGRRTIDYPRQCVFVGTINPDASGEYLSDQTGNRRFWPIKTGFIKLAAFLKVREQLFAEAVDRFMKGEAIFIQDKHVLQIAKEEQEQRRFSDPWTDIINDYLSENALARDHNFTSIKDIWMFAIKGSEDQLSRAQMHRIANVLRDLGWERKSVRHPVLKGMVKAFVRTEASEMKKLFS